MKYKKVQLKDIADIVMGQSPKSQFYNTDGKGIPFLQGVRTFGENYPIIDTYTTSFNREANVGEILFSVIAPVGRVNWATKRIAIGRGLAAIRVKERYSPNYLYYLFKKIGEHLDSLATGTVFTSINKKELSELSIDIPASVVDQERVANYLKKIDLKIEKNNQINDNLLELAKASYRKVLAASNLTETKLKDFATITMGQSPSSKTYNEDKVGLALLNGAADFRNGIHPSKWTTDPKRIVNKGSYIFGVRATIGLTTKVFDKYAIGRGTGSAVSKDTVNDEFLYFVLDDMFKYFSNSGSGSVYINISKSDFNDYIFCKPQTNDLQKFHQTVGPIMNKIYTNKQENLILTQVKETLLNKYF